MPFHVINRGVGRQQLFFDDADYLAFENVLAETLEKLPLRLCAYCLMPNHWHFVAWPEADGDLGAFMQRLTVTHTARWKKSKNQVGYGHLYQGRYKSFPIESDQHFLQVVRYVERNALRANLVERAEAWPWSSLWVRQHGTPAERRQFSAWPVPRPRQWISFVNQAETEAELAALRRSVQRGTPYGNAEWKQRTANELSLEFTIRPRGRPKKRQ